MTILFVSGINDLSTVGITLDDQGRVGYLMDGNASVQHRMSLGDRETTAFTIFGMGVKQNSAEFKTPPAVIFNQIADPDTHRGALQRCVELCDQVDTRVINHPQKILQTSRDQVSQTLQGITGVVVPRTQRFQPSSPEEVFSRAAAEGFEMPFITRVAGLHGGVSMVKVDSRDDYSALHALPFDGRDFYLTEFVDYKSADGLYRKTRIAVVDGVPLIRHHLIDSNWMVHASALRFMDQQPMLMDEANSVLEDFDGTLRPAIEDRLSEITRRLGLDYYGIDCHIDGQGEVLIFEANANMNILYNSRKEYERCVGVIKNHILAMIDDRCRQVVH
jgi:glutathione synthase/RimK-type ligase-like ATP-grasp enzyme